MKLFNNIPIWENKRRLKLLKEFRGLVVTYFENSKYNWMAEGMIEKPLAKETREQINRNINQIYPVVLLADVSPMIQWTPPPAIGGYIQNIDTLINIFNLHNYQLSHDEVLGYLDRAIGAYEADQLSSWVRTCNPFWWFNQLLIWVTHLPFKFLDEIGFDGGKAEKAPLGKAVRGILYLVPVIAAFLTILNLMGWLETFKGFWN
jgi:hypothetical protein